MTDWDSIRRHKWADEAPPEWPEGAKGISMLGVSLLGIDTRTGELLWDGEKLVTERKLRLGRAEWWFALVTSVSAGGIFAIELIKAVAELVL